MKVKKKIPLKIRVEDTRMMPMNSVGIYRMKLVSTHGGIVPCTLKGISLNPRNRILSLFNKTHITDELACYTFTRDTLKGKDDRRRGNQTW